MADEQQTTGEAHVAQDLPANPDVETREETIARVVDSEEAVGAERGGSPDPSTRRGVQRTLGRTLAIGAAIGAAIGIVAGLILSLVPGPFETSSVGGAIGYMALLGAAMALVVGLLAALFTLEREDGRIERKVEQETGRGPEGIGDPADPAHDLDER
jgi:hypothetical protein